MEIALASVALAAAGLCAGLMGFAIQRGATCTVAAVDEFVTRRRAYRLVGMIEASLWVAGGLVIAHAMDLLPGMPAAYALDVRTVLGAALLGIGAYVNGACVFGAIARFGSGEWAYALTPVGFYVGCLTVAPPFLPVAPAPLAHDSPVLQAPAWMAVPVVALMLVRAARPLFSDEPGGRALAERVRTTLTQHVWQPHAATGVIGVTFVLILLLVGGTWAYTDVLADLARGMAHSIAARTALLVALFAGALVGGCTAGRFRSTDVRAAAAVKCFTGGALMAWGSLLIPGSNDGLILVGMPLLRPYAWVGFLTMCVAIAAAMLLRRRIIGAWEGQPQHG
jgi:toxin CptA